MENEDGSVAFVVSGFGLVFYLLPHGTGIAVLEDDHHGT